MGPVAGKHFCKASLLAKDTLLLTRHPQQFQQQEEQQQ